MFAVGDYVVKSNEGVCRIEERILMKSFDDVERPYFLLVPLEDAHAKVFIPEEAQQPAVRPVMTEAEALDLIGRMTQIESTVIESDKLREKIYKDALRSNDPEQLVGIIKSVFLRSEQRRVMGKKATVIDDRCFKAAEHALYSELSFALRKETDEVRKLIMDTASAKKNA